MARPHLPTALAVFAPMIHAAWADATLTDDELSGVLDRILEHVQLTEPDRAALSRWLDPSDPPSATDLEELRRTARGARTPISEADDLLNAIGDAIGIAGTEARRALEGPDAGDDSGQPEVRVDPGALHAFLNRDHRDVRERTMRVLEHQSVRALDPHDISAYRQEVLERCRELANLGLGAIAFPTEFGGEHEAVRAIAVFETLAFGDNSVLVKFGVQFGLFAGSIYQLGTRSHHERFLRAAAYLELPGCFAMTETGHGSNVRDIRTTATYDQASDSFIVDTPDADARKDYIGNAALHGRLATVFAQLRVGQQEHGVHAFLVPIRDEQGRTLPGIDIEDCGPKEGLNGIDNGRISFNDVAIPRENLLDRFGRVEPSGLYTSSIASPARRFFTMLGTLVSGRVSIGAASISNAKSALTIAIRYAAKRRQFGPEGEAEVPILDYLALQRDLLPKLAATYVLDCAIKQLIRRYGAHSSDEARRIEAEAAGFKAYASRHAVHTIQACREVCGGQGYLEMNRLAALRADTDVFTTFEGANVVLLQLVAKALLTQYAEHFGELKLWGAVGLIARRASSAIADRNPIATRRTDEEHLRDPDFQLSLMRYREDRLLGSLARRLKERIDNGLDSFNALNACQDHALSLAVAHVERLALQAAIADFADAPEPMRLTLNELRSLWALRRIEHDGAWFLEKGALEVTKLRAIKREINASLARIRPEAVALVDAFSIPDSVLGAPIATGSRAGQGSVPPPE